MEESVRFIKEESGQVHVDVYHATPERRVISREAWRAIVDEPMPWIPDPHGVVAEWKRLAFQFSQRTMARFPIENFIEGSPDGNLLLNAVIQYDMSATYLDLAHLAVEQDGNTALGKRLFEYAEGLCAVVNTTYPPIHYTLLWGPDEGVIGSEYGPAAHLNYNLGSALLARSDAIGSVLPLKLPRQVNGDDEITTVAQLRKLYQRITCNYARFSALSNVLRLLYFRVHGDDTYPSATTTKLGNHNPRPSLRYSPRAWALAGLSHVMADPWYAECETRTYHGISLVDAHVIWFKRVIGAQFLDAGSFVDQFRDVGEQLDATNGDFQQVPRTWERNGPDCNPFMVAGHMARVFILCLEDRESPIPHIFLPRMKQAVIDCCDIIEAWYQRPTPNGRTAIPYGVNENGIIGPGSNDLAYFMMPAFAWCWKQTGEQRYYDLALKLCQAGNDGGSWHAYYKHFQQLTSGYWVSSGFRWLDWIRPEYSTPWR